jgi:hypothetical protein
MRPIGRVQGQDERYKGTPLSDGAPILLARFPVFGMLSAVVCLYRETGGAPPRG